MLNRRRKHNLPLCLTLGFSRSLDYSPIDPSTFQVLSLIHWLNLICNDPAKVEYIRELGRFSSQTVNYCLDSLLNAGFIERTGLGFYVVTDSGEYYLRGIETQLTRLMDQSKLARWKPIKSLNDPRYKYLRAPNVKGVKKY